jgi:hypothetical protein
MPKFRLSEVIAEKGIKVADLSADIQKVIKALLTQENTLSKIDQPTAESLRLIAESLNISIFDLFTPAEKFYRIKIFEQLVEPEYSGNSKENLEKLYSKLPSSSRITFPLLAVYATQVLPQSILTKENLKQICNIFSISESDIKEESSPPKQTISVDLLLKSLDLTIDDLSIILEIPKKYIVWLNNESGFFRKTNTNIFQSDNRMSREREFLNINQLIQRTILCNTFGCIDIFKCNDCPRR